MRTSDNRCHSCCDTYYRPAARTACVAGVHHVGMERCYALSAGSAHVELGLRLRAEPAVHSAVRTRHQRQFQ